MVDARRLGHTKRAQRAVTPWPPDGCGGANPPRRTTTTHSFVAPSLSSGGDVCLSRRRRRVRFPSGAPNFKHQDGLTGRARGSDPRDGGSTPSPGAKPPDLAKWEGGGLQNRHERVRFARSGPTCWSSSEVERHAETVRVRRLKTVLQRHSRVAQRQEQLFYTQESAGSSPCLGNQHPCGLTGKATGCYPEYIEVRVLARVPIQGMAEQGPRRAVRTRESGGSNPPPLTTPV